MGRLGGHVALASAVILMASALALVSSRYQARQLYVERERLQTQARELDIEWRRLQLARAEYARHARVGEIARKTLKMRPITPEQTLYVQATAHANPPAATSAMQQGAAR